MVIWLILGIGIILLAWTTWHFWREVRFYEASGDVMRASMLDIARTSAKHRDALEELCQAAWKIPTPLPLDIPLWPALRKGEDALGWYSHPGGRNDPARQVDR